MYIEPNTTITLFSGVPLDSDFNNTIFPSSRQQQVEFFNHYFLRSFTNHTYQRVNSGFVMVEAGKDDIEVANYLIFENKAYGGRKYFGFVEDVEYVSDKVSRVLFKLDPLQTFHFDYRLKPSFVVREHAASDRVGENTLPENVELGPFVVSNRTYYDCEPDRIFIFVTNPPPSVQDLFAPPFVNSDAKWTNPCWTCELPLVNGSVGVFQNIMNAIAMAVMGSEGEDKPALVDAFLSKNAGEYIGPSLPSPSIANYKPRNNKLLTYPYVSCELMGVGNSVNLRYEMLRTLSTKVYIPYGPNPTFMCVPDYAGVDNDSVYAVYAAGMPNLAWKNDSYAMWASTQGVDMLVNSVANVSKVAVDNTMSAMNPPMGWYGNSAQYNRYQEKLGQGILSSVFNEVADNVAAHLNAARVPDTIGGNMAAGSALLLNNKFGFQARCMSIKREYAEVIDSFFDMFGYSTNKVKVPNRDVRESWCFTQAKNLNIDSKIPAMYAEQIRSIYSRGVTFWNPTKTIGDYSQSNKIKGVN